MTNAVGRSEAAYRADLIYAQARAQIDVRLWRAALGSNRDAALAMERATPRPLIDLVNLIDLNTAPPPPPRLPDARPASPGGAQSASTPATQLPSTTAPSGLGANAGYAPAITAAAHRTGLPAAALASIINAEAAKDKSGKWQTSSRNPRSTATGLGQFLSGTWLSEARRAGTWLHEVAKRNGWLGAAGDVKPEMRGQLLALRHDGQASINATADLARHSLDRLAAAGATIGSSVDEIAHAAYLGHNLGVGDAVRFLKGGLGEARARRLLTAQIGSEAATRQTSAAGGAAAAHRSWLHDFVRRHVTASRFAK